MYYSLNNGYYGVCKQGGGDCSSGACSGGGNKEYVLGMDLDAAIKAAAVKMGTSLPAKTEVALVSVASSSAQFSEYVISRLEAALVDDGKLTVLDRANLDKVREEQGFHLSGEVDDDSAKAIGKLLGAGAIVTGSFINLGDVYGLSLKAINMTTAAIAASYPADIAKSTRIETLLASGGSAGTPRPAQTSGNTAPVTTAAPAPIVSAPSAGLNATGSAAAPAVTAPATQTAPSTEPLVQPTPFMEGTVVPGGSLAAKLAWLQRSADSHNTYIVEVNANENIASCTLEYSNGINITVVLKGDRTNRTIRLQSHGAMFIVRNNVTFILDNNITLQGHSKNTGAIIFVDGGTFKMNTGSTISGNDNVAVTVGTQNGNSGTFTMNGGTISGNSNSGVWMRKGTFTMSSGTISGNGSCGVQVSDGASFTMSGGTITGNTSPNGGGVYVAHNATFTMRGGTITGNTARENGGGVYMQQNGTFTKTGGTITGYGDDPSNGNVVKDGAGTIARKGHAVSAYNSQRRKETTVGPGVNLTYNKNSVTGAWDN